MKLKELFQKDYIPSFHPFKEMYMNYSKQDPEWDWIPIEKFSIKKIKIDRSLFNNNVDENDVIYMMNNFYEDAWEAVIVNSDYYLLDGQHRLRLASKIRLKYINLIMRKRKDINVSKKITEKIR